MRPGTKGTDDSIVWCVAPDPDLGYGFPPMLPIIHSQNLHYVDAYRLQVCFAISFLNPLPFYKFS